MLEGNWLEALNLYRFKSLWLSFHDFWLIMNRSMAPIFTIRIFLSACRVLFCGTLSAFFNIMIIWVEFLPIKRCCYIAKLLWLEVRCTFASGLRLDYIGVVNAFDTSLFFRTIMKLPCCESIAKLTINICLSKYLFNYFAIHFTTLSRFLWGEFWGEWMFYVAPSVGRTQYPGNCRVVCLWPEPSAWLSPDMVPA